MFQPETRTGRASMTEIVVLNLCYTLLLLMDVWNADLQIRNGEMNIPMNSKSAVPITDF
jgi:hypothetical protein